MSAIRIVLFKSFVLPFYKQNAGLFAFLLFVMVAAVGRANGVGLLEYHFSLIKGILTDVQFFLFVLCMWFLYALKCAQFVVDKMGQPDYIFLSLLSIEKPITVFVHLFIVQIMILLPVLLYAAIVVWLGLHHHGLPHSIIILLFFAFILFFIVIWNQHALSNPDKRRSSIFSNFLSFNTYGLYWLFLFRYIKTSRKLLFLGIKTASCLILFGLIAGQSGNRSGLQMTILFYSFGLLGHGVLIYTLRSMEEIDLSFYRGMPVSLLQRFKQYALFYFIIFIPEIVVILFLTPTYITYANAALLVFFGYTVLLFLNSLLFISLFRKFDYLKIVTGLYLFIFMAVLMEILPVLCFGLLFASVYIFFHYYYRWSASF
jgi:hypothetical protein